MALFTDPDATGAWVLAPERSTVRFTNKTMWGLASVHGHFADVSGEGHITPDGALTGRLVIRADSVRTGIGMRDRHLRGGDFFDVERFPEIVVDVASAAVDGTLAATLTVRDIAVPITLSTTVSRPDQHSLQVSARGEVDRTRWGVSGNLLGMMPTITTLAADAVFTR